MELKKIDFAQYKAIWEQSAEYLQWDCLFVLPFWLETVHRHMGAAKEPYILAVYENDALVGVAPLALDQNRACFLGHPDVCDYQDMVCRDGYQARVLKTVLVHLKQNNIRRLVLGTLKPESRMLAALKTIAREDSLSLEILNDDVTYETALPMDWESYLMRLSAKQRHEVRRKQRRLENQGPVGFTLANGAGDIEKATDVFIRLFRLNRRDKAAFMNAAMEAYFRDLIHTLGRHKLLRLYTLELQHQPVAAVLCFDYMGVRYLYNSGYDESFQDVAVGVLCKVLSIRQGIEMGCRHYDFLKGDEIYKKRIGGEEKQLYQCRVLL